MALTITPATMFYNLTVNAASSTALASCTAIDGSAVVALGIIAQVTFNAAATAGAELHIYGGKDDGLYWYNVFTAEIPLTAGATVGIGISVLPGHKYYKAVIRNLDATYTITGAIVYAEPQVLS